VLSDVDLSGVNIAAYTGTKGTYVSTWDFSAKIYPENEIPQNSFCKFSDNTILKTVVLPNSITSIGEFSFSNCKGLTGDLTIPNEVKNIKRCAFQLCTGIKGKLSLPDSLLTIGDYAFSQCGLTCALSIPISVTSIGEYAFQSCYYLTGNLIIPKSISIIKAGSFANCYGFNGKLILPNSLKTIQHSAFSNCWGLIGDIIIPDSVILIDVAAFVGCNKFNGTLTLGKNIENVNNSAFFNCTNIKKINCRNEKPCTLASTAFSGLTNFTINVPSTAYNNYITAPVWNNLITVIRSQPLLLSINNLTYQAQKSENPISFTAFENWIISSNQSWLNSDITYGTKGDCSLNITSNYNPSALPRYASLIIKSANDSIKNINIEQNGNPAFKYFTTSNTSTTLSATLVNAVLTDKKGVKWFGTSDGLNRFDGANWKTYNTKDGLIDKYITSLVCDSAGNIWIGTLKGISVFDGTNWKNYNYSHGISNQYIWTLAIDKTNKVWAGSWDGQIMKFDGTKWNCRSISKQSNSNNAVKSIAFDKNNVAWIGTQYDGVVKTDGVTNTYFTTSNGLVNDNVTNIAIDSADVKWFATAGGASRYNDTTWYSLKNMILSSVAIDKQGIKWFGDGNNGLYKYDDKNLRNYKTTNGLVNNLVKTVRVDENGKVWIGTEGGLSCFDGVKWDTYKPNGLPDNSINAIAVDKQGVLWVGTSYGLSRFSDNKWTVFNETSGFINNQISSIAIDSTGNIWVGTNAGLTVYKNQIWTNFTTSNGLPTNSINNVSIDKNNTVWIGTNGKGVVKYDGIKFTNYTTANGLVANSIRCIAFDKWGNKWIGTYGGVSKYNDTIWVNYTTSNGLIYNDVSDIEIDKTGNVWISTVNGGGVSKFDGKNWTTYSSTNSGLGSNNILSVSADKDNNIWFGTSTNGVKVLNGTSWAGFNIPNGLPTNYFNKVYIDEKDNKWIGSIGGGLTLLYNNENLYLNLSEKEISLDTLNYTIGFGINSNTSWEIHCKYAEIYPDSIVGTGNANISLKIKPLSILKNNEVVVAITSKGIEDQFIKVKVNESIFTSSPLNKEKEILLYPNPTTDKIKITGLHYTATIRVFNLQGQELINNIVSSNETISVNWLPRGLYIIKVNSSEGSFETKLIKK